ncbi:MAG: hypothetical protein IT444_03275 [Phycisphaeraceae bacterium]|nr:hypothetical protein [Phycisphaeraceae bacterium]
MTITAGGTLNDLREIRSQLDRLPRFRVAQTLAEVAASWRMVYEVYLKSGLIHPNPYLVHTTPHHVSANTAVLQSTRHGEVEATLTAVVDGPLGLPMDSVYQRELDELRLQGRRITEYGLFAHVRQITDAEPPILNESSCPGSASSFARVHASVINLMRLAFYFALSSNSTDFIVGVHPRHARFYNRSFGFEQYGPLRTCPTVNHRPVVLLHANLQQCLHRSPLPHALDYCINHPVSAETFADRCDFNPREMAASPTRISNYLREKQDQNVMASLNAG